MTDSGQTQSTTLARSEGSRDTGDPGLFSSAKTFAPPLGGHVRPGELGGYHIDFAAKAKTPEWPPSWLQPRETQLHVATAQWGLGAYERFLDGDGEKWLAAARAAGDYLLEHQETGGAEDGSWVHLAAMPHTYDLRPPWLSAMAQGEGASLLVRIHRETGDDRYADAASRALKAFDRSSRQGGVRTPLGDGFFLEEYPTDPPSLVLNGGIFSLWGAYDVGVALGDDRAASTFAEGAETLAANIAGWDTGRWSLYDRFPHALPNVASSAYHVLHQTQLRATHRISPLPAFVEAADRFEEYGRSRALRMDAFGRKVAFRLLVPRNALLAKRTPFWRRSAS